MWKWEIISSQSWKFCVVKQSLGWVRWSGNQQSSAGHLLLSIRGIPWSSRLQQCPVAVATCKKPDFWRVLARSDPCLPKPFPTGFTSPRGAESLKWLQQQELLNATLKHFHIYHHRNLIICWVLPISASFCPLLPVLPFASLPDP